MSGVDIGAAIVPLGSALFGALATAFVAWLGRSTKQDELKEKREETLEEAAERLTLAQLTRMQTDIEALRSRVTECEAEIRRCESKIRELQTRGHKWYRWAHELLQHTLEARSRATPPERGWAPLPDMPNKFDLDDDI
jgi:predicted RNase H-like nuclease (RuvC/YqgF family)